MPLRIRGFDYRRAAFGDSWTDDNPAPGGHNGCDTRNDILDRDLVDKTYVSIKRCPNAVGTGTLHDPYTNATIAFVRGNQVGASVQIDHIVPLALAWDLGARNWTDDMRLRFANDPANLLAVAGQSNQDKGDSEPALWMPANVAFRCQYADAVHRGAARLRAARRRAVGGVLRDAAATCPTGSTFARSRYAGRYHPISGPGLLAGLGAGIGIGVRPEPGAVVEPVERAISSSVSSKSNTSRFSLMRSGDAERGMTTLPS